MSSNLSNVFIVIDVVIDFFFFFGQVAVGVAVGLQGHTAVYRRAEKLPRL